MAASDLLLLHGTIYGVIYQSDPVAFSGTTNSVEQHNYPGFDWDADVPFIADSPPMLAGPMTDNGPVEVVSWTVAGAAPYDLLTPWRRCGLILTRL